MWIRHRAALQRLGMESCHTPPLPLLSPTHSLSCYLLATPTVTYLYQSLCQAAFSFPFFPSSDRFCLFTHRNSTDVLCYKQRIFRIQTFSLCVIEKHQDSRASLLAHESNLICIIGFSQLWNSFDLPPSLVTEWDRQGVPLTSHMFTLSLLFYTLASFLSCMCFISSTDTQIYQSLTLHLSFFISSLQFVVITLLPAVVVFAAVSRVGVARLSLEFPVWLSHI